MEIGKEVVKANLSVIIILFLRGWQRRAPNVKPLKNYNFNRGGKNLRGVLN
jgi:hypothetical protein